MFNTKLFSFTFVLYCTSQPTTATSLANYPPTDNSWLRVTPGTPVLSPTEDWEGPCVCENVAMYNGSMFVMFYRGGWGYQKVGIAFSNDGIMYTKYSGNPVYQNASLYNGGQPWIFHLPNNYSTLWLYTTNNQSPAHTIISISNDGGYNWVTQSNTNVPLPMGASLYGNRVVWMENNTWYMLQELMYKGPWQIFLYTSTDGLQWSLLNNNLPLVTLQVYPGGMYGGPRFAQINGELTPRWSSDNLYHLWYHATNTSGGLPTDIYHATSADLLTWNVTGQVLKHLGGNTFEHDQVAGPVVLSVEGLSYLYYDGDNNDVGKCAIGLAMANSNIREEKI